MVKLEFYECNKCSRCLGISIWSTTLSQRLHRIMQCTYTRLIVLEEWRVRLTSSFFLKPNVSRVILIPSLVPVSRVTWHVGMQWDYLQVPLIKLNLRDNIDRMFRLLTWRLTWLLWNCNFGLKIYTWLDLTAFNSHEIMTCYRTNDHRFLNILNPTKVKVTMTIR